MNKQIFSILVFQNGFRTETSAEPENKKPSDPGKRRMKAFNDPRENSSRGWPHPSL